MKTQVWKRQKPDNKCKNQQSKLHVKVRKCNGTQNIDEEDQAVAVTVPTIAYKHTHTHTHAHSNQHKCKCTAIVAQTSS